MQPTSSTQKFGLRISDISCSGLPRVGRFLKHSGSFYLAATIAGISRRTYLAHPSDCPSWDDPLNFDLEGGSQLMIQVIDQHRPSKPKLIGELSSPIEIAGDFQGEKRYSEQCLVRRAKEKIENAGSVSFTLTRLSYFDASELVRIQMQLAGASVGEMETAANVEGAVEGLSKTETPVEKTGKFAKSWGPLLDKVGLLITIGDAVSGINPYAKMAWKILSLALKAIEEQKERDERILGLLDTMNDSYNFVDATKPLRTEDLGSTRREIIKKMLQQTYDCAWFIRDYTSRGFFGRAVDSMANTHDLIVEKYIKAFNKLKECFESESLVGIEVTVHRTLALAQEIRDDQILDDMAFATDQRLAKQCLAGTRETVVADIIEWVHHSSAFPYQSAPCVYWLHGVAGCGKSAIASTIAQQFEDVQRCVWYFFDALRQNEAGPNQMFSTLSRGLADMDRKWRESLVTIAKGSRRLRTTPNVREQFENFILKPAAEFDPMGPILVVIDALDESGSKEGRAQLLQTLGRLDELNRHGRFRFLITSRPEDDILPIFSNKSWVLSRDLTDVDKSLTNGDIRRYVDEELSQVHVLAQEWPDKPWVDLIARRADHLFQWAFVSCAFIKGIGKSGVDPVQRYVRVRDDPTDARLNRLDQLYTTVLRDLYGPEEDNDEIRRFCRVLGRILSAREPLSLEALTELRPEEEAVEDTERIVSTLGSLLKGTDTRDKPIQPLHASFIEFLRDRKRSGDFYVEARPHDAALAQSCLRVMNEHLRFNMCNLESSYVRNRDVENLSTRVQQNIPEYLVYACRYFADHLGSSKYDARVPELIREFLWKKLLFWLEVLSLLKCISQGLTELLALQAWVKDNFANEEVRLFIDDAIRFVRAYGGAMEMSTPHIYLSLLAFIPTDSPLWKAYSRSYPGGLKVTLNGGKSIKWTSMLLQIQTLDAILAVRFSPDSKFIASGSSDSTVRIWEVHSGQPVGHPFQGHTDSVTSVGFSPDGKLIVSGSDDSTVRVWDVHTGQPVGHPFQGHTSLITSVAFAPNSKLVVSGSLDSTVRVWDVHTGQPVGHPFQGQTSWVRSVGFSPDGNLIVSGSDDSTVRVWDVHTGQPVGDPFQGHTDLVSSVGFSPDGNLIVSGSGDSTVRVWDVRTGQPVGGPFQGHTDSIFSVKFSPDGNFVVSGSNDSTVRVWNVHTGQQISHPFQGHTSWVRSVDFSPDGNLVVSCSNDLTVRVWDVHTAQPVGEPSQGHPSLVTSVGFSPDGNLIVSGSDDSTIRIWNVHTGQPVGGPFLGHTDPVTSVGFSPDGKLVISGSLDSTVRVWDVNTGQPVGDAFQGHTSWVTSVEFSPNRNFVVSGSDDSTVRVWDVKTGQPVGNPFQGHTDSVTSVGFSPDGKLVVSGSLDSTVRVWDVYTSQPVGNPFQGHTESVRSVEFSPDGKLVVSGSSDSTIRVWNIHTGQPINLPFQGHALSVRSVGFSPDGKLVASGSLDSTVRIWDVHAGQPIGAPFQGHTSWVNSVGFSPDGKLVVSGSSDSTIRVWDVHTHQPISNSFQRRTSLVTPVGFLPDAGHLVSGWDRCRNTVYISAVQSYSASLLSGHSSTPSESIYESKCKQDSPFFDNQVCYTDSSEINDDGWVLGPSNELLFWVPPSYRPNLWRRSNIAVFGSNSIKLDLTRFVHGENWYRCYKL